MKKLFFFAVFLFGSMHGYCQTDYSIQMVLIKGGNFFMGSDDPRFHSAAYDNERPIHRVSLGSYFLAKYEVTQGLWRKVMGMYPEAYNGVDYANKECDNCPVVKVNYEEAQEFIRRLNAKTGKTYRMPTETEWEYAARGGKYSKNFLYAGSNKLADVAWYGKRRSAAHKVGEKEPNELGLYDMSGNVAEWCQDWFGADYYQKTVDEADPKGPLSGDKRVVRGGSYYDNDVECRNTNRGRFPIATRQWNIGFRLAMDAPE